MEVVMARDDDGAREVAREHLERTHHHLAVDVWEDDRSVGSVRRMS
jgi:DNA-binding FadR family transcriptional regulator